MNKNTIGIATLITVILCFLFPGLGQLVSGRTLDGLKYFVIGLISLFLMIILIGFIWYPIIWILSMRDAYKNTEFYL